MSDLIRREDAIDALHKSGLCYDNWLEVRNEIDALPSAEAEQVTGKLKNPCDSLLTDDSDECKEQKSTLDLISKQDIIGYIDRVRNSGLGKNKALEYISKYVERVPSAEAEQTNCTEFVNWLLEEVMDEEMWELNAVAYGEVIARKLKKLGLLEVKDGYYIRHIENNTKESDLVYRPSAEAIKVIRCKDCIAMEYDDIGRIWCKVHGEYFTDDYFCADGKRKGGDDE